MSKFKIFLHLGIKKQRLFIQAYLLSGIFRFMINFLPFKRIKKFLGEPKLESSYEINPQEYHEVRQIRSIVLLVCKYTPWESKCLVRAMLVQYFLKRKKIATTIYLGVNKDNLNNMKAHAWIRCGEIIVTGQYEKDHFIQVACFSNANCV